MNFYNLNPKVMCAECMSVDALVEYAGDIVAVVEKLRTIQENVKRFIDN